MKETAVISIIDDDESVRSALSSLIEAMGLVAFTFSSAKEFLQSPHLDTTSCVISDVRMPEMDGFQLQERLGSEGRHIPIILMTAFPDESARRRAIGGGAVAFLPKPFKDESLAEVVGLALRRNMP